MKEETEEPQAAAIEDLDNQMYLNVVIGGTVYRTLYDTGATCSLIGPAAAKHFADKLLPSKSRIRAFNRATSAILRVLPVTLEIEDQRRQINFGAVDAINQEMLLGTDFRDTFDVSAELGKGLWRLAGGRKRYSFANVKDRPEEPLEIKGQVVDGKTGKGEKVGDVEEEMGGWQDWVCIIELVCENKCCV